MTRHYKHHSEFRSFGMMFCAAVFFGSFYFATQVDVPKLFLWFLGGLSAIFAYNLVVNPVSGVDMQASFLRAYFGKREYRVTLREVDYLVIKRASEGDDSFTFFLKNGKKVWIPPVCLGKTDAFEKAVKDFGITVKTQ